MSNSLKPTIPTFNRAKILANCLSSINIASETFSGKFEVYVSRNCSSDQAVKMVENVKKILRLIAIQIQLIYVCQEFF